MTLKWDPGGLGRYCDSPAGLKVLVRTLSGALSLSLLPNEQTVSGTHAGSYLLMYRGSFLVKGARAVKFTPRLYLVLTLSMSVHP